MDILNILNGVNTPNEQEVTLEKQARKKGFWFGDERKIDKWGFIGSGCEARVYADTDITKILKVVSYNVSCHSPKRFLDERIVLYNLLFPETAYELIGFAKYYDDFCFVVKQSFIEGCRLEMEEIEVEMQKRGFNASGYKFVNQEFAVEDLHQGNVLKDKQGNIFVIDAIPSFVKTNQDADVVFNDYYQQRREDMQKSVEEMEKHPLSFEKKREQTQFILNSLYL
ncbi:hypothetical protein [Dysgonomonas sp. 511]|uniref:putative polyvalent protein kinase domain-containing protein n=1 Tax=Dysgonomonas sp. 511 TaxID=2302930 RepID=UPI0013D55ECF|nr:hypothetical protein [Dysgonomonas sp. 511]NDV78913.1 hypothetical protein [Dysgonomonas sp. 511]